MMHTGCGSAFETNMAGLVSDSDVQAVRPSAKRRRILDPSAMVPVPVYSSKVSSSLQLRPRPATFSEEETTDDGAEESLWLKFPTRDPTAAFRILSDSEEDEADHMKKRTEEKKDTACCPSPPPLLSPVQKHSRKVKKTMSEVDRRLQALDSLLTPDRRRVARPRHRPPSSDDDDVIVVNPNDDDAVAVTLGSGVEDSPCSSQVRQIPLKIRCRTDVHKIAVLSSTPLSDVVDRLSAVLDVPPSCLLLLRDDMELRTDATVGELGIGITDIIECVVMAAKDKTEAVAGSSVITVRLQGKDRRSSQEFSLHRDAPLGSVFSQYLASASASAKRAACFLFDGSKVGHGQTPAQLDMEDGDIIEVWI